MQKPTIPTIPTKAAPKPTTRAVPASGLSGGVLGYADTVHPNKKDNKSNVDNQCKDHNVDQNNQDQREQNDVVYSYIKYSTEGIFGVEEDGTEHEILSYTAQANKKVFGGVDLSQLSYNGKPLLGELVLGILDYLAPYFTINKTDKNVDFKCDIKTEGKVEVKKKKMLQ